MNKFGENTLLAKAQDQMEADLLSKVESSAEVRRKWEETVALFERPMFWVLAA